MSSPILPKEVPTDFHLAKVRELEKKLLAAELLALHHQRKREELQDEVEELQWDYEALKSRLTINGEIARRAFLQKDRIIAHMLWQLRTVKRQRRALQNLPAIAEESSTPTEEPAIEKPASFCSIS